MCNDDDDIKICLKLNIVTSVNRLFVYLGAVCMTPTFKHLAFKYL